MISNWNDEERVRDELLSEEKAVAHGKSAGLSAVLFQWTGREKSKELIAAKIGEEKIAEKCWEGVELNGKATASDIM